MPDLALPKAKVCRIQSFSSLKWGGYDIRGYLIGVLTRGSYSLEFAILGVPYWGPYKGIPLFGVCNIRVLGDPTLWGGYVTRLGVPSCRPSLH